MKILLFSPQGDGIGIAFQLMEEGHQVHIYMPKESDRKQGEGIIWHSTDWQADARESDLIVFDNNGHGEKADNLRKIGLKVWNGGSIADRLERNRSFGMRVCEKAGIPIPETFDFKNYMEASSLVEDHFKGSDRVVIKLNHDAGCATSYISKDKQDMLTTLEAWENEKLNDLSKGGIIQRFIEGIEVSVEGWFDGEKFMYPYNWTMEDKKLLAGNLGPNVGCAFTVTRNIRAEHPKIARLFLEPLIPLLKKSGYVGQIDVNTIVSDDGDEFALEHTPRPGYDATPTLALGLTGLGDSFAEAWEERQHSLISEADRPFDFLSSVRVYIPPYPFEAPTNPLGIEVYSCVAGVPVNNLPSIKEFVPYDVMKNDEGSLCCAGTCGVIGIAMGSNKDIGTSIKNALSVAEKIEVPNKCFRSDGGHRVLKEYPTLEALGLFR